MFPDPVPAKATVQPGEADSGRVLSRRTFLRWAGASILTGALAACTPPSAPLAPPAGTAAPEEAPPVRFQIRDGVYGAVAEAQGQAFRQAFPDLALQVEVIPGSEYVPKLEAALADATAADCFWAPFASGFFHQQAHAGNLASLASWLDPHPSRVPWQPDTLDAATYQGQPFGLPWACHPGRVGCYVNLTLCAEAGIEPPPVDGDWTWADLQAMARALTRRTGETTSVYGANIGSSWPHILMLVRSAGGEFYNDYGNRVLLQSPPVLESLTYLHAMLHVDQSMPTPDLRGTFLFEEGNVALSQNGYWGAWIAQTQVGGAFDMAVVPMPRGPAGQTGSMLEIEPICLHRHAARPEAAWSWLTFLCQQATGIALALQGAVPGARTDVWQAPDLQSHPGHAVFAAAMQQVAPYRGPANLRAQEASAMFDQGMAASWYGGQAPALVVPALEKGMNALLALPPA